MKVEQRIGRIDRLGQAAEKIIISEFLYAPERLTLGLSNVCMSA